MIPFVYNAIVRRVVDGDTIVVDIDLGFHVWLNNRFIRLTGLDTPETRTKNLEEKEFGLFVKSVVEGFLPVGSHIHLLTDLSEEDKFGRILGTVHALDTSIGPNVDVNQYLLNHRFAVPYEGKSKEFITEEHVNNFRYLKEKGLIFIADDKDITTDDGC